MDKVIKLSRWREHVPFTLPLTLLGGLMAYRLADDVGLDWRLGAVAIANILAVTYAFIINDVEDAEDDKHEAERGARNAISTGELSRSEGLLIGLGMVVLALILYAAVGGIVLWVGVLNLALAHLYSWKPVRLKALPILDLVSHVLFLSTLLFAAGFLIYDPTPPLAAWLMALSTALFSAYGQLYNQNRDFEADRAAGLKNTASVIGKRATSIASLLALPLAAICALIPVLMGVFPLWLLGVILVASPLVRLVAKGRDMRGDEASDAIGDVQVQFLLVLNILFGVWLVVVLVTQ